MALDFTKTAVIKTANPRKAEEIAAPLLSKTTDAPRSPYQIELLSGDRIRFSARLFQELQLANNSLSNGTHPDIPGKMLLIVNPGDAGKWANGRGTKDKGRTFKNINLIKGLRELGYKSDKFNVEFVGDDEQGNKYYTFEDYLPSTGETKAEPVADKVQMSAATGEKPVTAADEGKGQEEEGEGRFN